ncbi:MAG TPA: LPS assembly protein LptD [Terriglobia bacterium]|nr:LPS assembly protein LptD [Terriglobia bacterium]
MSTQWTAFLRRLLHGAALVFRFLALVLGLGMCFRLPAQQSCSIPSQLRNPQTTLTIHADSQKKIGNLYELRGHVVMTYREMRIAASQVTYDDATGEVLARGNVVFDDPKGHLEAESAEYNIDSDRGWFTRVHGYMRYAAPGKKTNGKSATPLFLRAERIERLNQNDYAIERVQASSCEKASQGLAFELARAKLQIGQHLTGHGAVFRFLGIPILYFPFFRVAASQKPRQSGLLLPQIGESTQKGFVLGDGFFWAINPSSDLMVGVQDFSLRGVGFSARFRARPSASSSITADFFGINDRASGALRALRVPGESFDVTGESDDLGDGFRGVVDVGYVNSLAFRSTWSDNFNSAVFSEARQTGFATKNFGPYSINFYASRYQDFLSFAPVNEQSIIIRHLPSVSFAGVDKQVGKSPFYFAFDTSLDGIGRSEPGFQTPTVTDRVDLYPRLTLRSRPFWGFHLTPTVGFRDTYYGTSLKPDHSAVNRFLGDFSADLRPPSLEKVFAHPLWGRRFKHVIEPDIKYRFVRASDPQNILDVVRFDTTDILTEDNELEYSLTNVILERKDKTDAQGNHPQARDLISWTLTQKYFFDPTFGGAAAPGSRVAIEPSLSLTGFAFPLGRRLSPLDSVFEFSPTSHFDTEFRTDIDPQGGGLLNAGVTSRLETHSFDVAFTDFFVSHTILLPAPIAPNIPLTALPTFNLLDLMTSHGDPTQKGLSEGFRIDYNLAQDIAEDFVGQVSYNFGCFALNGQIERFNLGFIRNENMFRLSITLGNIATFGSLKPAELLQRQMQQIP